MSTGELAKARAAGTVARLRLTAPSVPPPWRPLPADVATLVMSPPLTCISTFPLGQGDCGESPTAKRDNVPLLCFRQPVKDETPLA
jgi:hypothetical protein